MIALFQESLASQSLPSEMNTTNEAAPENARTTVSELSHRFLSDNLTIEEFVKLVLAVIKENSFCPSKHRNQESSEEILRKKRLQVNASSITISQSFFLLAAPALKLRLICINVTFINLQQI